MGIYIFSADVLIEALEGGRSGPALSSHDFGKDIIPKLLGENKRLYSYEFHAFLEGRRHHCQRPTRPRWTCWATTPSSICLTRTSPIMSNITTRPPHYIGPDGRLDDCLVSNGCKIYGTARHSIPFDRCHHRGARRGRGLRAAAGCAR